MDKARPTSQTSQAAAPAASSVRRVPCPACKGPALFDPGNRWRPFCSERCRTADLGAWASEQFRLPAATPPDDDAERGPGG